MLRTVLGPATAGFLGDASVVEVMLTPTASWRGSSGRLKMLGWPT